MAQPPGRRRRMPDDLNTYLSSIYFNLKQPGSFRSPKQLYRIVREKGQYDIGLTKIRNWLQTQDPYSLNRPVRRRFRRRKVLTGGLNQQFEADLMDVQNLAKYNENIRYILICIDVFSRYVMVAPLKDKTAGETMKGFTKIFEIRQAQKLHTDRGKEFTSNKIEKFFRDRGIVHFLSNNEPKASLCERFIRSLRNIMYRYFNAKQTYVYLPILDDLVNNYNHTPHSALGIAPADVTPENEVDVLIHQYFPEKKARKPKSVLKPRKLKSVFKFKLGDKVRISHLRRTFDRGYHETFTGEIFTVVERVYKQDIPLYKLRDYADRDVSGTFYQNELHKVVNPEDIQYRIEHVLKTRRRKGHKELLVKWLNWPSEYNSWIDEGTVVNL
ncbi:uncharacterized protein [Argopecten irradians]|uniref:uncharacterized protein n=1 Tax=Argopecten irradians TaxID=31199 RepID=UPI00371F35C6